MKNKFIKKCLREFKRKIQAGIPGLVKVGKKLVRDYESELQRLNHESGEEELKFEIQVNPLSRIIRVIRINYCYIPECPRVGLNIMLQETLNNRLVGISKCHSIQTFYYSDLKKDS